MHSAGAGLEEPLVSVDDDGSTPKPLRAVAAEEIGDDDDDSERMATATATAAFILERKGIGSRGERGVFGAVARMLGVDIRVRRPWLALAAMLPLSAFVLFGWSVRLLRFVTGGAFRFPPVPGWYRDIAGDPNSVRTAIGMLLGGAPFASYLCALALLRTPRFWLLFAEADATAIMPKEEARRLLRRRTVVAIIAAASCAVVGVLFNELADFFFDKDARHQSSAGSISSGSGSSRGDQYAFTASAAFIVADDAVCAVVFFFEFLAEFVLIAVFTVVCEIHRRQLAAWRQGFWSLLLSSVQQQQQQQQHKEGGDEDAEPRRQRLSEALGAHSALNKSLESSGKRWRSFLTIVLVAIVAADCCFVVIVLQQASEGSVLLLIGSVMHGIYVVMHTCALVVILRASTAVEHESSKIVSKVPRWISAKGLAASEQAHVHIHLQSWKQFGTLGFNALGMKVTMDVFPHLATALLVAVLTKIIVSFIEINAEDEH